MCFHIGHTEMFVAHVLSQFPLGIEGVFTLFTQKYFVFHMLSHFVFKHRSHCNVCF